jgi:hypothetical protein
MLLECVVALIVAADWRDGMQLVGDARREGKAIRLAPAENDKAGAAWKPEKVFVAGGFETVFQFRITESGGLGEGADGIAFVVQNTGPEALAGRGGAGGYQPEGKRRRPIGYSVAVHFDTFHNGELQDPSNNYVGAFTFGRPEKAKWPPPRLASSRHLAADLKSGMAHDARIVFRPPLLTVFLNGEQVLRTTADLRHAADREGNAWIGFTASTGGGFGNHDLLDWRHESVDSNLTSVDSQISFVLTDCLPGRNLCTPREGRVEEKAEGVFEVMVPGHLDWPVSIANPRRREVEIRQAAGFVCRSGGECVKAEGNVQQRHEKGRTYFGAGALRKESNEGYFAFEAILR